MDGGVANNTPISHAVELGAQRIFVLPTGHACALEESPRGALALALHAISLLTQRRLVADVEQHRKIAHLVASRCLAAANPADRLQPRRRAGRSGARRRAQVPRQRRTGSAADSHARSSAWHRARRGRPPAGPGCGLTPQFLRRKTSPRRCADEAWNRTHATSSTAPRVATPSSSSQPARSVPARTPRSYRRTWTTTRGWVLPSSSLSACS